MNRLLDGLLDNRELNQTELVSKLLTEVRRQPLHQERLSDKNLAYSQIALHCCVFVGLKCDGVVNQNGT